MTFCTYMYFDLRAAFTLAILTTEIGSLRYISYLHDRQGFRKRKYLLYLSSSIQTNHLPSISTVPLQDISGIQTLHTCFRTVM